MTSMNWNELISKLKSRPVWVRIVVVSFIAALSVVALFSCSTIRTTLNAAGEVSTTVHQSALDSTKIEVNLFAK